jgi:hypothetical protein
MAGLSDTPDGGETRRHGNTVGVPHGEDDGTALANAAVQPGDAVTISGGVLAQAGDGDTILGVLVNYDVFGASHRGEQIAGDVDATVAVQGTYKARADSDLSAGDSAGVGDTDGHFGNVDDQGFRVVDTYSDGAEYYVEVVL